MTSKDNRPKDAADPSSGSGKDLRRKAQALARERVDGTSEDITERKGSEERIRHLNAVLKSFVMVNEVIFNARDQGRLLVDICRALTATRGYHNAWMVLLDENRRITDSAQHGVGDAFQDFLSWFRQGKMSSCACKALDSPLPRIVANPQAECADCPLAGHYSARAGFSVRLDVGGRTIGLLSASVPRELARDTEERELFMNLAGTIAQGVERIRLETIQRDQEQRLHHYERIISKIKDPMSIVDKNYRYIVVNDAYLETFNKQRHEIEGHAVESLFGKEIFENLIKPRLDEALAGRDVVYEGSFPGPGWTPQYWIRSYYPCHDEEGDVSGVVVRVLDITDRKHAEKELASSLKRYDELVARVPVVYIFWIRADGRMEFEYVSDRYCTIYQLDREDVLADLRGLTVEEALKNLALEEALTPDSVEIGKGRFIIGAKNPRLFEKPRRILILYSAGSAAA